jgi:hypothetical protein
MKAKKDSSTKAESYSIGDTMEGDLILGISKGSGRYYFLVKGENGFTILGMASSCNTHPATVRNVPEKCMSELVYFFETFKEG